MLNDEVDKIEDNYCLYIAKKKGTPKDDFPGKFFLGMLIYFFWKL